MSELNPDEDGKTHINIYSKGKTEIGRILTNVANVSFVHEDYGSFNSVDGLWYWLLSGKTNDNFRKYSGFEAKAEGKKIPKENLLPIDEDFKSAIKKAFKAKVKSNPNIIKLMYESDLPFEHYYYYGKDGNYKVINQEKHKWQCEEFERLRNIIKDYYNEKYRSGNPRTEASKAGKSNPGMKK